MRLVFRIQALPVVSRDESAAARPKIIRNSDKAKMHQYEVDFSRHQRLGKMLPLLFELL